MDNFILRIGPLDIDVVFCPLNEEIFGDFCYIKNKIRIEESLSGPPLVDTLIHEVNHAVWKVGQLSNKKQNEERAVAVMASIWTQIYRDNPRLLDWIGKNLEVGKKKKNGK